MSFKLKLALWFAVLALLPLTVAFVGLDSLAKRSETQRVDATLESALRGAVVGYGTQLDAASTEASRLASEPELQAALRTRDRAALVRALRGHPFAAASAPGISVGKPPALAGSSTVAVVNEVSVLGHVVVWVPFDASLVRVLGAGLPTGSHLVATRNGRIVVGSDAGAALAPSAGAESVERVGGTSYRTLASAVLGDPAGVSFVALAPQRSIDSAVRSTLGKLAVVALAALAALGLAAYLFGSSIVATLRGFADAADDIAHGRLDRRVRVRGRDEFAHLGESFNDMATQLQSRVDELEQVRGRVRDANARFADALAATHDPAELVRIVVESAVEASDAVGGLVLRPEGELARVGNPDAGSQRIAFPLRLGPADFGSLVVAGHEFEADQVEAVASLAARAVVALDNARLHRIVERQALFDSLTGLANRRSLEETLQAELTRAQRFHDPVCFVLADLDDFKRVNDTYGHPVGDQALRAFASVLARSVREIDVAGRWGGEEFALILPGTDAEGGARLAERARAGFEQHPLHLADGHELSLTASFGVAAYPDARELAGLIAAADSALYAAKGTGKNRVVLSAESIAHRFE